GGFAKGRVIEEQAMRLPCPTPDPPAELMELRQAEAVGLFDHFGFGTWGNASDYEATVWDFTDRAEVGRLNTQTSGQSYMPAVVVPIPIIAPVQGTACDGLGDQLLEFLSGEY
ncbi:MAG: hypothetical protein AAF640_09650, partial [Pseudomonadota bacterium]